MDTCNFFAVAVVDVVVAVADGGAVPVILVLVLDLMRIFYENILCLERRKTKRKS